MARVGGARGGEVVGGGVREGGGQGHTVRVVVGRRRRGGGVGSDVRGVRH